jgi:hypothetical protein
MASSPKLSSIDLSKLLTPAATLRPRAAQRCVTKQARGPGSGGPPLAATCRALGARLILRFGARPSCRLRPALLTRPTPPLPPPQDHGLMSGLDVHLIPHCRPALVEKDQEPEPV